MTHVAPGLDPAEFVEPVAPAPLPPGPWVVYAGNPDRYQDLDVLVEAMRRLPEAGLLLVSASALSDWEGALPKLELRVTSSFSEVKRYLAAAAVAALPRTTCTGYPIKLLNYLAMGQVTVAAEGSAQPLPGVVTVPNRILLHSLPRFETRLSTPNGPGAWALGPGSCLGLLYLGCPGSGAGIRVPRSPLPQGGCKVGKTSSMMRGEKAGHGQRGRP